MLNIIDQGYYLSLIEEPRKKFFKNQQHSPACRFCGRGHLKLEDSGSIVEMIQEDIHISSPLGVVPKKNNKFSLILDLHYLKHLASFKFKFEDLRIASVLLDQGDCFFTFDLLNGYPHIDIGGEYRIYLGFSYQLEGRVTYFVLASLPFGLSTAPYVFTKLMRPLVNYWRGKAKKMLMYMDDGIGAAASKNTTRELATEVKNDLHQSGLLVNSEKSDFQPRQVGEFLGYTLDLESGKFRVPRHKIDDLQSLLFGTLSGLRLCNCPLSRQDYRNNHINGSCLGSSIKIIHQILISCPEQHPFLELQSFFRRGGNQRVDILERKFPQTWWPTNLAVIPKNRCHLLFWCKFNWLGRLRGTTWRCCCPGTMAKTGRTPYLNLQRTQNHTTGLGILRSETSIQGMQA